MLRFTLQLDKSDTEYEVLYTLPQIFHDLISGQIFNNWCLSNAFQLQLGHNLKIFLVEMQRATWKEVTKHVM
jgi:hypothetical protein